MLKHEGENCVKLCISSILSSKRGITPTKFGANWRHSNLVVQYYKDICKIPAQYVKACRRKVRKTVYFQDSKFQKGHNSKKSTDFDDTQTWSNVHKKKVTYTISAQYVIHVACRRKVRKNMADRRRSGRTDRHHHTIIRPVWRRAYTTTWYQK